ncbi:MAG: DNA adenine methylase, partial [Candidatus Muirbacterium halophilum]|nr:DNA adenine methylase [Candidatus Muirbacterium halophilum]
MIENENFLTQQIITYLGNKRKLLDFIGESIKDIIKTEGKTKVKIFDGFAGSGIVSRYFKQYASELYTNDFESYSKCINNCYLTNYTDIDMNQIIEINEYLNNNKLKNSGGFIRELYSPIDDKNIIESDRTFYTNQNALIIDNIRGMISDIDPKLQHYFLAPLLYEASVHVNTSGVFKGFYKDKYTKIGKFGGTSENALQRILGEIKLQVPIFSNYECDVNIFNKDTNELVKDLPEVDITYYDPPYNEHPYGSNYFMLNLIYNNERPKDISKISGIPTNWNKSPFYKKKEVVDAFDKLIENT